MLGIEIVKNTKHALHEENQGKIAEWLGCGNDFNDELDLSSSAGQLNGLE